MTSYYAAMRPGEALGLRRSDCTLPASGWGRIELAETRPSAGKAWTDSGEAHDRRGLKQRAQGEVRIVPIPPPLVRLLREHLKEFGTAKDSKLFSSERGKVVAASSYSRAWKQARELTLVPDQVSSVLAFRPYDLRHAGVSCGSTKCIYGQEQEMNDRIMQGLGRRTTPQTDQLRRWRMRAPGWERYGARARPHMVHRASFGGGSQAF